MKELKRRTELNKKKLGFDEATKTLGATVKRVRKGKICPDATLKNFISLHLFGRVRRFG